MTLYSAISVLINKDQLHLNTRCSLNLFPSIPDWGRQSNYSPCPFLCYGIRLTNTCSDFFFSIYRTCNEIYKTLHSYYYWQVTFFFSTEQEQNTQNSNSKKVKCLQINTVRHTQGCIKTPGCEVTKYSRRKKISIKKTCLWEEITVWDELNEEHTCKNDLAGC